MEILQKFVKIKINSRRRWFYYFFFIISIRIKRYSRQHHSSSSAIITLLLSVSFKPILVDFTFVFNMLALSAVLILFIVCVWFVVRLCVFRFIVPGTSTRSIIRHFFQQFRVLFRIFSMRNKMRNCGIKKKCGIKRGIKKNAE